MLLVLVLPKHLQRTIIHLSHVHRPQIWRLVGRCSGTYSDFNGHFCVYSVLIVEINVINIQPPQAFLTCCSHILRITSYTYKRPIWSKDISKFSSNLHLLPDSFDSLLTHSHPLSIFLIIISAQNLSCSEWEASAGVHAPCSHPQQDALQYWFPTLSSNNIPSFSYT